MLQKMKKRLLRSSKNKKIAGVCGGLAEYFDIDPAIVRIIFFVSAFWGFGILLYIVCWICIPKEK